MYNVIVSLLYLLGAFFMAFVFLLVIIRICTLLEEI